jgi:hypothetical protein
VALACAAAGSIREVFPYGSFAPQQTQWMGIEELKRKAGRTTSMGKYDWDRLNHLQVGKYAEYFVKMEFVLYGFDIYTSEVDDRGIDFVIRRNRQRYYDVQVKSVRGFNYIFFAKDKFELAENLFAAVVVFPKASAPELFLIPSTAWEFPDGLCVSRDYEGKQSKPEWGLDLSQKTYPQLQAYLFDTMVETL